MKTKIFKVIYESKEMYLMTTKLNGESKEEKQMLNDCDVKESQILFEFIDQSLYREEDGFMLMIAKTFIGENFDSLQSGQDIELAIEMKKKKSCYNCENFNREDDWCKVADEKGGTLI
jgi:hypothetical protein